MTRLGFSFLAAAALSCQSSKVDPESKVESVRILATRADKPYAAPSDTVNLDVLAFDGRANQPQRMSLFWVPAPCINPPNDAYYACYADFASAFAPGVDVTASLVSGTSFSFSMPADVIARHQPTRSGPAYGLAVVFTIACAGHVEFLPSSARAGADALPIGCFDENHGQLGPADFTFAYSLVYAFENRSNQNPVFDHVAFGGAVVDPAVGITVDHCTNSNIDDCPTTPLDVIVPASDQERDPGSLDAQGNVLGEEIYVDYFVTEGKLGNDVLVLFDPKAGFESSSTNHLSAPQMPGDYMLWTVLRDNRGGASWLAFQLHAR